MTNSILSLYRVFFIDENDQLWALCQDGRVLFMKQVPPFASFSSDHTLITGVEIDGTSTFVRWMYADFQTREYPPVMTCPGYCYYPALLNKVHSQLAIIQADLLNPAGMGKMLVYQKARKKFHLIDSFETAMCPPFFANSGSLYYIASDKGLYKKTIDEVKFIHRDVSLFALSANEEEVAVYTGETIRWISPKTGQFRQFIAFNVSAIGFSENGEFLYFATHKQGRTGIYQYNKNTQEITLLLNHSAKITAISF